MGNMPQIYPFPKANLEYGDDDLPVRRFKRGRIDLANGTFDLNLKKAKHCAQVSEPSAWDNTKPC